MSLVRSDIAVYYYEEQPQLVLRADRLDSMYILEFNVHMRIAVIMVQVIKLRLVPVLPAIDMFTATSNS